MSGSAAFRTSPRIARTRSRLFVLALAVGSLSSAAMLGCEEDEPTTARGAVPSVLAVSVAQPEPPRDDAGSILGGCCALTMAVTYVLPEGEFIRDAHVQWTSLESPTIFQYPASEAVAGTAAGTKTVSFEAQIPSVLVTNGAKLPFTVVLVTGRGEKSAAAGGMVTFTRGSSAR